MTKHGIFCNLSCGSFSILQLVQIEDKKNQLSMSS